jgi:hypothetical protein
MKSYIIEIHFDDGTVVILKVEASRVDIARKQAFQFSQDQGWGIPKSLRPHVLHQNRPIEQIVTLYCKPVAIEVEREPNYTPKLEYA